MKIEINVKGFFLKLFAWIKGLFVKPKPEPQPEPPPPEEPEPIPEEPEKPFFGASVYELVQQKIEDIKIFLERLKEAGGNATEIFLVHSHNGNIFQPYAYYDSRWFDLDTWNEAFWHRFHHFLTQCKLLGVAPFIRIHDFCSIKRPEISKFYCFMNNVQGFKSIYDEGLYPYYSKLNKRLLKELRDAGIKKFYIVPMNECDGPSDKVCYFYREYTTDLWTKNVPNSQIIISTDPKHFDRLKGFECRLEVHDVARLLDFMRALQKHGYFVFPNGDGTRNGKGTCSHNRYCEPSPAQFELLARYIKNNNLFGYCYKARRAYQTKGEVHPELVKFSALKALVGK